MINISLNKKIIFFGFIFTFFSSFGQSFFLGLFNPSIRNELNITHGQFGTIYAISTICSSLVLVWFGKKIDEFRIFHYSLVVVFLLFLSCFIFSMITNIYLLIIALFLMRFSGQGLMSHTSTTTISRYFNERRGKALSAIWFGLSSAEFILPIIIIFSLSIISWKTVWQLISLFVIFFLPFVVYNTVREINSESRENNQNELSSYKIKNIKQWKRKEVIKDYRFYIISLNMLAMPWIITGIFVYQSFISESKLWDAYVIPKSFMAYSISSIITLFSSGFLVDRFSSRKLIPLMNIPLLFGLIFLYSFDDPVVSIIFFILIGISNGLANVLGSSTWAEIYGVKFIGSIKALTTAFMVFSTAFGTAIFGFLIDRSFSIEQISLICSLYISISLILLLFFRRKIEPVII
jgi:predicted MFS family arabinose efflux permease